MRKEAKIIKIGKYTIALGWIGNCRRHCLCIEPLNLTTSKCIRRVVNVWYQTGRWSRTDICFTFGKYFIPTRFTWNSNWLARKFGELHEADFGDYWIWNSKFLGQHTDI